MCPEHFLLYIAFYYILLLVTFSVYNKQVQKQKVTELSFWKFHGCKHPCVLLPLHIRDTSASSRLSEASVCTRSALSKSGRSNRAGFSLRTCVMFWNVKLQAESLSSCPISSFPSFFFWSRGKKVSPFPSACLVLAVCSQYSPLQP